MGHQIGQASGYAREAGEATRTLPPTVTLTLTPTLTLNPKPSP